MQKAVRRARPKVPQTKSIDFETDFEYEERDDSERGVGKELEDPVCVSGVVEMEQGGTNLEDDEEDVDGCQGEDQDMGAFGLHELANAMARL